jgi:hypothetical protein
LARSIATIGITVTITIIRITIGTIGRFSIKGKNGLAAMRGFFCPAN